MSTQLADAYRQAQGAELAPDAAALAGIYAEMRQITADELASRGGDRQSVLAELEELRERGRAEGRDEDIILELMDYVSGWCSPRMKFR